MNFPSSMTDEQVNIVKKATNAKVRTLKNSSPKISRLSLFNLIYNRIHEAFDVKSIKNIYAKDFCSLLSFIFELNYQNILKNS